MPDIIRKEIERQCSIGAGTCSHETGQLESTGLLVVQADLDIATLERVASNSSFHAGVLAAVQVIVDDIGALCRRRRSAGVDERTTQVVLGIARRISTLPLPPTPEDAPMSRSSVLLDLSTVSEDQIVAAARALRDAELDVIEAEIMVMPADEQDGMRVLLQQHLPPPWDEMDLVRQQTYIYRARRALSAALLP